MIQQIRFANFKSFVFEEPIQLPRFLVLVGDNGAGKTNFCDAFDFARDVLRPIVLHEELIGRIDPGKPHEQQKDYLERDTHYAFVRNELAIDFDEIFEYDWKDSDWVERWAADLNRLQIT